MAANSPLLSVVIPTCRRPQYLPRAVESALKSAPDDDVEVIVVPNGPDLSWEKSLLPWRNDERVRVSPIKTAHANAARNHGMELAKGKYVRFLDDDDYFYLGKAKDQLVLIMENDADICSGGAFMTDEVGTVIRVRNQPKTRDFITAFLSPYRLSQPLCHVFKASFVKRQYWDVRRNRWQDTDWMLRMCASGELKWISTENVIGAWVQHCGIRVSRGTDPGAEVLHHTAKVILSIVGALEADDKLTTERRCSAADGLWSILQKGLYYERPFWFYVARSARKLANDSRPPSRIYWLPLIRKIDPIWIAFALLPVRWLYKRLWW